MRERVEVGRLEGTIEFKSCSKSRGEMPSLSRDLASDRVTLPLPEYFI